MRRFNEIHNTTNVDGVSYEQEREEMMRDLEENPPTLELNEEVDVHSDAERIQRETTERDAEPDITIDSDELSPEKYIKDMTEDFTDIEKKYYEYRVEKLRRNGEIFNPEHQAIDDVIDAREYADAHELDEKNGKKPDWFEVYIERFKRANDFDKAMELISDSKQLKEKVREERIQQHTSTVKEDVVNQSIKKESLKVQLSEELQEKINADKMASQITLDEMKVLGYIETHKDNMIAGIKNGSGKVESFIQLDENMSVLTVKGMTEMKIGDYLNVSADKPYLIGKDEFEKTYKVLENSEELKPFVSFYERMDTLYESTTNGVKHDALIVETNHIANHVLHNDPYGSKAHANHWQFMSEELLAIEMQLYAVGIGAKPTIEELQKKTVDDFKKDVEFGKREIPNHVTYSKEWMEEQFISNCNRLLNMGKYEWQGVIDCLQEGLEKQKIDEQLMKEVVGQDLAVSFERIRPPFFKEEMTSDERPYKIVDTMEANNWKLEPFKGDRFKTIGKLNIENIGVLKRKNDEITIKVYNKPDGSRLTSLSYNGTIHGLNEFAKLMGNRIERGKAYPIEQVTQNELLSHFEKNSKKIEDLIIKAVRSNTEMPKEIALKSVANIAPHDNIVDKNMYIPLSAKYVYNLSLEMGREKKGILLVGEKLKPQPREISYDKESQTRTKEKNLKI